MSSIIAHGDAHQRFFELAACGHQFEETFACFDCYLQFSNQSALDEHLSLNLPGKHRTLLPNPDAVQIVDEEDDEDDEDEDDEDDIDAAALFAKLGLNLDGSKLSKDDIKRLRKEHRKKVKEENRERRKTKIRKKDKKRHIKLSSKKK